jgi:hypothetical protein
VRAEPFHPEQQWIGHLRHQCIRKLLETRWFQAAFFYFMYVLSALEAEHDTSRDSHIVALAE